MEYIAGKTDFKMKNSAVTLGKFDGLHRGHQLLINKIMEQKSKGYQAVMFTFMLHPGNLFSDKEIELIYTEEEKRYLLENWGLDVLVSYPFTKETVTMEPEDFIKEVLINKLDAKMIVVGSDFRFGRNRRGDAALLKEWADHYGYELCVMNKILSDDKEIGSSYIRSELKNGNMELVNELLGNPYSIMGPVLHGRKIGRTIGFPTINLIPESNKLLPPDGVYASVTTINGEKYPGLTNIGLNPTVGETPEKRVETYIFDYDSDLYNSFVSVALYSRERGEEKFNSLEELKEQMNKDINYGREYFKNHKFL